ncbi:hypothetical protein GY26_01970 [Gammaproteobacteria bacterium MFB021]|nr:hypothetical protein GY26_01970 [Gammaproteobacteria bacterium MFB021]
MSVNVPALPFECPYCGTVQNANVENDRFQPLTYCDVELDGCNNPIVLSLHREVSREGILFRFDVYRVESVTEVSS